MDETDALGDDLEVQPFTDQDVLFECKYVVEENILSGRSVWHLMRITNKSGWFGCDWVSVIERLLF